MANAIPTNVTDMLVCRVVAFFPAIGARVFVVLCDAHDQFGSIQFVEVLGNIPVHVPSNISCAAALV